MEKSEKGEKEYPNTRELQEIVNFFYKKRKNDNSSHNEDDKVKNDRDKRKIVKALTDLLIHNFYLGEETTEEDSDTEDENESEDDNDDSDEAYRKKNLETLRSIFKTDEKLKPKNVSGEGKGNGKTTTLGLPRSTEDTSPVLKFKDCDGIYFCPECDWSDKDNSFENFLAHCRTSSHKNKMKNRFTNSKTQTKAGEEKKENVDRPCLFNNELSVKKKDNDTQKPSQSHNANAGKLVNKYLLVKKPEGDAVPKDMQGKEKVKNFKEKIKSEKKEIKTDKKTAPNLMIKQSDHNQSCEIPTSGLLYVEVNSKVELTCTLCSKVIPSAFAFVNLINNVFTHVMGDPHKKKLEQKNAETLTKSLSNNSGKSNDQHKNNSQYKFLCVPCNHFGSTICAYDSHTESLEHVKTVFKSGEAFQKGLLCMGCDRFLCGSITAINNHYMKCCKTFRREH